MSTRLFEVGLAGITNILPATMHYGCYKAKSVIGNLKCFGFGSFLYIYQFPAILWDTVPHYPR